MDFDFQAAYDDLNPADDDYRFYAALAASAGVTRAVDLGCGTGTLARMLASRGASVVGVDPDPGMLRVARSKDPEGRVDWRLGYSDAIDPGSAPRNRSLNTKMGKKELAPIWNCRVTGLATRELLPLKPLRSRSIVTPPFSTIIF